MNKQFPSKNPFSVTFQIILMFLLFAASTSNVAAQKNIVTAQAFFKLPTAIPVPKWAQLANWAVPNVREVDSLLRIYGREAFDSAREVRKAKEQSNRRHDVSDVKKLGTNSNEIKEYLEEPYFTAYVRWRRSVEPFVQPNGSVKPDSTYGKRFMQQAEKKMLKATPSTSNRITGLSSWSVLGPVSTIIDPANPTWHDHANVYRIAVAASNNNILYCGSETGGIFKTTDKGLNWACVSDGYPPASASALAVNPSNPNEVFWATNSGAFLKTTTGGGTWSVISSFPSVRVAQIVINPAGTRIIASCVDGRIYYSSDGGTTWALSGGTSTTNVIVYDLSLNPGNADTVYAATKVSATNDTMRMLRSTNAGVNFMDVTTPKLKNDGARIGVSPADANIVYCLVLDDNKSPSLLKSIDRGLTWTISVAFAASNWLSDNVNNGLGNGQGYYDQICVVNALNANEVMAGTSSLFRSTDGGFNFAPLAGYVGGSNYLSVHPDMQSAVSVGSDTWMATDGGPYYSSTFFGTPAGIIPRHTGITGSDYWGFGQGWAEDMVVGGRYHNGNGAVYSGYPSGQSIALGGGEDATGHMLYAPGKPFDAAFRDIGTVTVPATINGTIERNTFTNSSYPQDDYYGNFSSKLMIDPRYSSVLYLGKDTKFWKSINRGASYNALHDFGSAVWRFDISRTNPNVIYVLTQAGINKTINGGTSWSTLSLPAGVSYAYYNADIAVDPANENTVWLCMAEAAGGNKVFKSVDGGSTWVNYGSSAVNDKAIAYILPHGGSATGGAYAIDKDILGKVYYRDANTNGWIDYSIGLPDNFRMQSAAGVYYGTNKIRMASNRGIWESPLYDNGLPLAQPMADRQIISCSRDTVRFTDHSILRYAGATFSWSFPGASYVSSTSVREPKVIYPGPGNYNVTLAVTDVLANTSTKTVNSMITFSSDNCVADTVAGLAFNSAGRGYTLEMGTANINSNNFTLSCWFRPNGKQTSFSQLIGHYAYPGSTNGFGMGFSYNSYTPNLNLCYTDNLVGYGNASGLIADTTKWNYAVLTYAPTGVTLYLNGVPAVVNSTNPMPVIDLSKSSFFVNADIHGQEGFYKGEIDEVKIYNYALTQNEVREKMHLIQKPALAEIGLLKYMQFNKVDPTSGDVYELSGPTRVILPSVATAITSTAPVATGTVFRKPSVNAGGQHSFPGTGIDLFWPTSGTFPNGELVGFRLHSAPDQKPTTDMAPPNKYFIVNNYGTNATFTALSKVKFSNLPIPAVGYSASNFSLYKRPSTAYGATWGSSLGNANTFTYGAGNTSFLEFTGGNTITSFSQFGVGNGAAPLPVTLLNYTVQRKGTSDVLNKWTTANELNADYFAIERSNNGTVFIEQGRVTAIGNSTVETAYNYLDVDAFERSFSSVLYYRLRIVSDDGSLTYSPVRKVRRETDIVSATLMPIPLGNMLTVLLDGSAAGPLELRMYSSGGQLVRTERIAAGITRQNFDVTALASGMYLVQISGNGLKMFEQLISKF